MAHQVNRRHRPRQRKITLGYPHDRNARPVPGWLPDIRNVQVQTHSRCNADCLFCPYVESTHAAAPGKMRDETWKLIIDNLRPFAEGINQGKFCPYLMQEPLIDLSVYNKIEDVYQAFPKTCVEVSTNGAALTDANIASLLRAMKSRRHEIWVSHHGIDRESLKHIMRIDYCRAVENLLTLIRTSDGEYNIRIRGAGESSTTNRVYFTREQYREYWTQLAYEYNLNMTNVEVDAFQFHDRAGTLHRNDRNQDELNKGIVREIDPHHPFHCSRISEWLHFMWDGSIRLCCMDYHGEITLPNIHDMSLLEYFHSDIYQNLCDEISGRVGCKPGHICTRCTSPGG